MSTPAHRLVLAGEIAFSAGLLALGFLTGQPPLVALASICSGAGGNIAANLTQAFYERTAPGWFGVGRQLNHHIAAALADALRAAVDDTRRALTQDARFTALRRRDPIAADNLLHALATLAKEADTLAGGTTTPAPWQDPASLLAFAHSNATAVATGLGDQLRRYAESDDTLVDFAATTLHAAWPAHFRAQLKANPDAWIAYQLLLGEELRRDLAQLFQLGQATLTVAQDTHTLVQELHQRLPPPAPTGPLWVDVPPRPNLALGRDKLLNELADRLVTGGPALAVDGMPGVGKTTLALLLAHHPPVTAHFTGGVLWASLGPTATAATAATVQAAWADALGVDLRESPDLRDRQRQLDQALTQRGQPVLIVLDDVWASDLARSLRSSAPGVVHLLTTRHASVATDFAGPSHARKVPVLDPPTAWELLQRLAPDACAADPAAARALADRVGGLPLALAVLGGYLHADEHRVFADLAQDAIRDLGDPAQRLALAATRLGDPADSTLDAILRLSVDDLAAQRPGVAPVFWALGAFAPQPATFARAAAETVAQATPRDLALLVGRNLLSVADGQELAVHQVIGDLMATQTPDAARASHARYYAAAMQAADDQQHFHEMLPALPQLRAAFAWAFAHDLALALDIAANAALLQQQFSLVAEAAAWSADLLAAARGPAVPPTQLAHVLNHRGNCLGDLAALPGEDRAARLHAALAAYDEALRILTPAAAPQDYAMTQNNRGACLRHLAALPDEDRPARLAAALAAYDEALRFHTPAAAPQSYAITQNNRGTCLADLADLPGEDRAARLHAALAAYDEALRFHTPAAAPLDYAWTQNSRGNRLRDLAALPGEDRAARLHAALAACDEALRFHTPAAAPLDYARTRNNRGNCLGDLAALPGEDRAARLHAALAAYDEALRILAPATAPLDYAITQHNRGYCLADLADLPGEDRAARLHAALAAYDEALRILAPAAAPLAYAKTQHNRGVSLRDLAALPGEDRAARLHAALAAFDEALRFHTPSAAPQGYAGTQHSRGIALYNLAALPGEDRAARLHAALAAFDEAITHDPAEALYQRNRVEALIDLGRLDEARTALARARALDPQSPDLAALAAALTAAETRDPRNLPPSPSP
jgi:hypothetical protein